MATPNQKADARPISFALHDAASGAAPVVVPLIIRPEDLTRADSSRLTTTQTLGGAFVDSFGAGMPTVQISGTTGWGSGNRASGIEEFEKLYRTVYTGWHKARDKVASGGMDPNKVRLIFSDGLDDFTWVVAPNNFVLKRSKSRPLLAQYQINLTWLSDAASEDVKAIEKLGARGDASIFGKAAGLASLTNSIDKIKAAATSGISRFLGPVQGAVDSMLNMSADVIGLAHSALSGATSITGTAANGLLGIASSVSRAAANAVNMVHSTMALPQRVKAQFQRLASAYENVFCLLGNIFKPRTFLPNYDGLYGASNCSSTSGGAPISRYDNENPFAILRPLTPSPVSVSPAASTALSMLKSVDPVLAPMSLNSLSDAMLTIGQGVMLRG